MAEPPEPPDKSTEAIRKKLRDLYSHREQRRVAEAMRQLDKALPPEQREALLRSTEAISELANSPAVREAMGTLGQTDTSAIAKAIEQLQRAEAARLVWENQLLDQAIAWLESKWGDRSCPYCGETEWVVGTPLEISLGREGAMSPAFPVMCGNCGQTTLVNAIVAGLVDEPDEESGAD